MRRGSPLPISNREVKPDCADGTAVCGRVCRRLLSVSPDFLVRTHFFTGAAQFGFYPRVAAFFWKACLSRQAFLFIVNFYKKLSKDSSNREVKYLQTKVCVPEAHWASSF